MIFKITTIKATLTYNNYPIAARHFFTWNNNNMTLIQKAVIDEGSKALEEASKTAGNLLARLLGPSADTIGLMWQNNLSTRRLGNAIRNLKKVNAIIEREGLNIKDPKLKVLMPYLDGISLEENETLQDMWANLFVNYIDASKNLTVTVYPAILAQLSTDDIKILYDMDENNGKVDVRKKEDDSEYSDEAVANLVRLGLIEQDIILRYDGGRPGSYNGGEVDQDFSSNYLQTDFGFYFTKACKR